MNPYVGIAVAFGMWVTGFAVMVEAFAVIGKRKESADKPLIRSMKLLNSWLTMAQRREYLEKNKFTVIGGITGKHYQVECERKPYNISEIDENGKRVCSWCFVPVDGKLPLGDLLLMQKLSLELDESEALRIANMNGNYWFTTGVDRDDTPF